MIEYRKGIINDLKDIQNLNSLLVDVENSHYDIKYLREWAFTDSGIKFFSEHLVQDENKFVYLAVEDKQIIGYILITIKEEAWREISKVAILEHIYVLQDHRNMKVGTELFDLAIQQLQKQKIDLIRVTEVLDNNKQAQAFYKQCGFHPFTLSFEKLI